MTLSSRLQKSMDKAGMSQNELARRVGVSQAAIQKLISGKSETSRNIFEIANCLGVDPTWLVSGDPSENDTIIRDDCVNIPFFREISLPSDGEEKTIKLDHEVNLHFSRRSLKKVGVKPQNVACVKVSGNSMNPVMSDGSIVIIDTDNNVIVDGDIYVINQHNNLRVKIIYRIPSGGLRLRSFNSTEWPDEFYDKIDDIVILGRVFWYSSFI